MPQLALLVLISQCNHLSSEMHRCHSQRRNNNPRGRLPNNLSSNSKGSSGGTSATVHRLARRFGPLLVYTLLYLMPFLQHEQLPRNDTSPPDRKRVRRSPAGGEHPQPPPMTPMAQFPHGSQQVGPGGPHQMPNGMIGRPMGAFPGQPGMPNMGNNPGMNMQMGPSLGAPQMNNAMNAQMVSY